jgi:hypothetical protein
VVARSAEGQQDEAPRARVDELATHRGADADEAVGAEHLLRALDEQGQLAVQHEVDLLLSTAGNLLQRTRCVYFQDVTTPCNKREQGGS